MFKRLQVHPQYHQFHHPGSIHCGRIVGGDEVNSVAARNEQQWQMNQSLGFFAAAAASSRFLQPEELVTGQQQQQQQQNWLQIDNNRIHMRPP